MSPLNIQRVRSKIEKLKNNLRPEGYKKLTNYESDRINIKELYRIRIGDIRAINSIEEKIITVTVIQVHKSGDIY